MPFKLTIILFISFLTSITENSIILLASDLSLNKKTPTGYNWNTLDIEIKDIEELSSPSLLISLKDGTNHTFPLKVIQTMKPFDNSLEISFNNDQQPIYVDDIIAIGIIFNYNNEDASVENLPSNNHANWQIFDMTGKLIREGNDIYPDLSNLNAGQVYIIISGGKSYKYMPCR